MRDMLDAHGAPRPALELALRWLDDHKPTKSEVTLVHGDFRTGNFLVGPDGLQAVLDWEFARWGTPAEDLAWLCVRDWRFGRLDRPVGGFARREPFYQAYEEASGRRVDPDEVFFWEVVGNLRWAMGSLHQGRRYAEGEHDIELIAVARRASEMEWEALRLIGNKGT
jgi:aminoglycoside phosphotransferase (APT) family kinase protein